MITVKNLCFKYDKQVIFENLNLEIPKHSFTAIIGENGAGKSTFVKLLLNQITPLSGSIEYFETNIAYISQHAMQQYRIFPTTVEEILKQHLKHLKKKHLFQHYLTQFNLTTHRHKSLSVLSGGELQRVGIMLAFAKDANLIILDEPTIGIDAQSKEEVFQQLKQLTNQNKTIIMITHELQIAEKYVDHFITFKKYQSEVTSC